MKVNTLQIDMKILDCLLENLLSLQKEISKRIHNLSCSYLLISFNALKSRLSVKCIRLCFKKRLGSSCTKGGADNNEPILFDADVMSWCFVTKTLQLPRPLHFSPYYTKQSTLQKRIKTMQWVIYISLSQEINCVGPHPLYGNSYNEYNRQSAKTLVTRLVIKHKYNVMEFTYSY